MSEPSTDGDRLRVGISACLVGQEVRFNGGHKRDDFAVDVLGAYVDYVPVCPEVDLGLGVPRPTLRLEGSGARPLLIEPASRTDHTVAMEAYAAAKVAELAAADLDGYILKRASPSCGMERVKLYPRVPPGAPLRGGAPATGGAPSKAGVGLFAAALMRAMPELPVEEEGRLGDARLRDNFVERLFAYRRLRRLFDGRWDAGALVRFHTAEKMLLLAHDEPAYRALGRLVANHGDLDKAAIAARYRARYMSALAELATPKKHTNVLQHMAGHLKDLIDAGDRAELTASIDEYRRGLVPLIVPITLLRHHVRRHHVDYLLGQRYLEPHPRELMLRNHV